MAQGRGNACAAGAALLLIVTVVGLCRHTASAATYTVGAARGWDIGVDYTSWAADLTFKTGDILFFPYSAVEHNVVVVDKAGYDTCSEANAITTYSDGNTNVTLSGTGPHYYLCSVVGHCSAGMKLAVTISAAATAPAPSTPPPSTPPPSSPPSPSTTAPAPATTPSSSPTQTPSTSPSPSPTAAPSSSAPSPAPAPGSAETPTAPASSSSTAPTTSSSAPGSTTSSAETPPSPPPPNAAHSLQLSAAFAPCLAMAAALLAI